jgi:hypothetical protein
MMNFMKFGMQNEKSESFIRRTLARWILAAEKKRADLTENWLIRKQIQVPEKTGDEDALLKKIQAQIDGKDRE